MSRIAATFAALQEKNRKALIPFVTAGDPDPAMTVPLMHALAGAGADVIELGVPFSDPMADGPTIQRSSERALKHGTSLKHVLGFVAEFRQTNNATPVVLMGYANPIEAMGYDAFSAAASTAGVDGVLVVDYPPQEAGQLSGLLAQRGIDAIFLLAPTSTSLRIGEVARHARGYIYYVSLRGVTGAATLDTADVHGSSRPYANSSSCRSASDSAYAMRSPRGLSRKSRTGWSSAAASSRKSRRARARRSSKISPPWSGIFAVRSIANLSPNKGARPPCKSPTSGVARFE